MEDRQAEADAGINKLKTVASVKFLQKQIKHAWKGVCIVGGNSEAVRRNWSEAMEASLSKGVSFGIYGGFLEILYSHLTKTGVD